MEGRPSPRRPGRRENLRQIRLGEIPGEYFAWPFAARFPSPVNGEMDRWRGPCYGRSRTMIAASKPAGQHAYTLAAAATRLAWVVDCQRIRTAPADRRLVLGA